MTKHFLVTFFSLLVSNSLLAQDINIQENIDLKFICDLEKKIIYNYKELGLVEYNVDEENLLPALREGIRLMKSGEIVLFFFPS